MTRYFIQPAYDKKKYCTYNAKDAIFLVHSIETNVKHTRSTRNMSA